MSGTSSTVAAAPGPLGRARARIDGWTPEIRQAIRILVSVFLSDVVARGLHLREPYWALITAVIVTQARISSTLEAGRDQILGTLIGAVAGACAIALALTGLPKLPVFAVLLVPLALLAAFKPNLRLAGVTLVVTFLFPAQGSPFSRPVDRVLAILVGASVSLLVSYLVFHSRARRQAFQAASDMLGTLDDSQSHVLTRQLDIAEVERLNEVSTDSLKTLVAAIAEARRERLTSLEQHEPLMVRLVPMLRRLQSDMLFVARAVNDTTDGGGPDVPPDASLAPVSAAISRAIGALRTALEDEAGSHRHEPGEALLESQRLSATLEQLGDAAGPLPRFTLQMLSRDIDDMATALKPENNDRAP
jgi:uncharacterized membrane protein YccC